MSIVRLPAKWHTARREAEHGASPFWSPENDSAADRPADELLDLYGTVLVAVPLALFLRWLWP